MNEASELKSGSCSGMAEYSDWTSQACVRPLIVASLSLPQSSNRQLDQALASNERLSQLFLEASIFD